MYKELERAIKHEHEVILSLTDGSKIAGIPRWGENMSNVRIKTVESVVWVPLNEIKHVTILLTL